jgi:hypothetical protein
MDWRRIAARLDGPWTPARYWVLSACAVLALLCWLPHPYYGEEPVYAIITIETWWHGSWLNPVQLGSQYGRPPLLNWVVMPFVWVLGWDHLLLALRLIALASTLATAALVAWFAHYLSRDRLLSAFAVACFLTGDLLTQRGWIAYSFYGAAGLVLLWRHENRRFLLSPASLVIHATVIAAAPFWIFVVAGGQDAVAYIGRLTGDITARAHTGGLGRYVGHVLAFWGEIVLRLLPPSALLLALLIRPQLRSSGDPCPPWAITLRWMLLLGALPYLLTTDNHMRHILPLYPLFAIVIAELALRRGRRLLAPFHAALIAWIVVTIPVALVISPWIATRQHGNSAEVAALIDAATKGQPLYTGDGSAETLAVIAHLDVRRLPAEPVGTGPHDAKDGFFLFQAPAPAWAGKELARYPLGQMNLALLCRGSACKP